MSYAYQPAAPSRQPRRLKISVRNSEGQLIEGSAIQLIANNSIVAEVVSSNGQAIITDQGLVGAIQVLASAGNERQILEIDPRDTEIEILLPTARSQRNAQPPEAHCHTTGQKGRPCVNCPVGGSTVRICC